MRTLLKIIGGLVGLLAIAYFCSIWLLTHTFVDDLATVEFPPHPVRFKVWAETDADIQNHWVYFSVEYGKGQSTAKSHFPVADGWDGKGTLTKYVSEDAQLFVARWNIEDKRSFFYIFDLRRQDDLLIEWPFEPSFPGKRKTWPRKWKQSYEQLRAEFLFLPALDWESQDAEQDAAVNTG
jgi:hypothetical protein